MSTGVPRVDVGIVCWNTRELSLEAIDRLRAACDGVDVRVLVRDQGTDGTADAVRARFPEVHVVEGENLGFAGGVNHLLALSDAPWFVTLNSDAWPEPRALRRLVDVAHEHPAVAVVAPLLRRPSGELEHSTHALPGLRLAAVTAFRLQPVVGPVRARRLLLHGAWAHDTARPVGWAVGAALLLRRAAVDELGPFDASLFMYGEDLEWCWRARRAGWEVLFTPDAVVRHVGNASGEQRYGVDRERVAIANANAVVRRYRGPAVAAAWRGLNAAGAARSGVAAVLRGEPDRGRYWLRQVPVHLGRGAAG